MFLNQFQKVLGSKKFKQGVDTDTNIQLPFESKTKPLVEYDIIDIVNQYELFQQERENSNTYRFNGKLNIYTSNALLNNSTITDNVWDPLFYGNPKTPLNWVMQVVYPSKSLPEYLIRYKITGNTNTTIDSKAFEGLQYLKFGYTEMFNSYYLTISTVQKHNLNEGDYIYLKGINNYIQNVFRVKSLGINGLDEKKTIVLDVIIGNINDPLSTITSRVPNGYGNIIKINDVSTDDINFNNANQFSFATTSDLTGSTLNVPYTIDEEKYVTITTNQPHGLTADTYVDIRTNNINPLNGVWKIKNVPTNNTFVLKINFGQNNKGQLITTNVRDFRKLDAKPSEYYVRQFEVLTSARYETYNCAYGTNVYPKTLDKTLGIANDVWLFHFNEDVKISELKTNRGIMVTEVFFSMIKRAGKNPIDWSNVVADWDFNSKYTNNNFYLETISLNNQNSNGSIEKANARFISGGTTTNGSFYIGDFVEFNPVTLEETQISEIIHRFGLQGNPNNEGYYYKPFKKLTLRKYSKNLNIAPINDVGEIPDNSIKYDQQTIAWKDLLPIGFFEDDTNGVEYPFINGTNYFYFDHNLFVRRQNPPIYTKYTDLTIDFKNTNTITQEC